MRRDLIIGILLSLAVHGGIAYFGELSGHTVKKKVVHEDAPVIKIVIPPPEPEDTETVDNAPATTQPLDLAPPMQADAPQVATPDSFIQQTEPPPPEGAKFDSNAMKIAANRSLGGGATKMVAFNLKDLDQQPVAKAQPNPVYPSEMQREGINGEVMVAFILDSNGDVRDAHAISSSNRAFEEAAVQAVSRWKFRPGHKGGRAVNTKMQVPITFNLSNDE